MTHLVPTYVYGLDRNDNEANRFAARPLRQWRKQLNKGTYYGTGYSRASIGMPMDRPGEAIKVATTNELCQSCSGAMPFKIEPPSPFICACPPKLTSSTIGVNEKQFTDTASYLYSRGQTYEQRSGYNPAVGITYFTAQGVPIEPSDSPTGTQNREANACVTRPPPENDTVGGVNNVCVSNCETIYKPNNVQFAQQGGVSSSSRLARLKYNTLNNNGSAFLSASGAVSVNAGSTLFEPSPSYYNKYKPQAVVIPRKNGAKTYCGTPYSICLSE